MADFTFLYPWWLLAALPLALLLPWVLPKQRQTGLIAPHLAKLLGASAQHTQSKRPLLLLASAWLSAVIGLAGPSFDKAQIPAFDLAGARVLVMDMSASMRANDIAPNRLEQAKYKAIDMLPGWQEGSTGLVAYAGDGYIVSPLTKDANTLKNLILNLSPEIMPIAGNNAAAGIKQGIDLLKQAGLAQGDIILITDGLTATESAESLKLLDQGNYRLSVLAIATEQGAPVPDSNGKLLENNGKPVIATLDINTLKPLTQATRGQLQLWQPTNQDVDNIVALTEKPQGQERSGATKAVEEQLNQGYWFILPALLLALISFRRGLVLCALLLCLPLPKADAAAFKNQDQVGFNAFQRGDYDSAAQDFSSRAWKGAAQYKAGDYQGAIDSLSALPDPTSRYNLANAYAQTGQFEQAIKEYEAVLEQDPAHKDAQHNLDEVKKAQQQQQQQQQDDKKNEGDKNQQQQDKQGSQNSDSSNSSQQGDDKQGDSNKDNAQQSPPEKNNAEQQDKQGKQDQGNAEQDNQNGEKPQSQSPSSADKGDKQQADSQKPMSDPKQNADKQPMAAGSEGDSKQEPSNKGLLASDPVLKKLEQVPDDTAALLRAQLLLQARQRQAHQ